MDAVSVGPAPAYREDTCQAWRIDPSLLPSV